MGCCDPIDREQQENDMPKAQSDDGVVDFQKKPRKADDELDVVESGTDKTKVEAYDKSLIVAPTKEPKKDLAEPKVNVSIEYVYGYKGIDCKQNLYFSAEGNLVYHIASLGIVLNPKDNTQIFFGGKVPGKVPQQHDDCISCLAISPDGKIVATGQGGRKPKIFVWKSSNCDFVSKYVPAVKDIEAFKTLAFSKDGTLIAAIDKHKTSHNLYVIDVATGKLLWTKPTGPSEVLCVAWTKDGNIVLGGKNLFKIWSHKDQKELPDVQGLEKLTFGCVACENDGKCYAGDTEGTIYVIEGNAVKDKIKTNKALLSSIVVKGGIIYTGGKDGNILIKSKDNTEELKVGPMIRAIDVKDNFIVAGDLDGNITLFKDRAQVFKHKGHYDGEVWGLEATNDEIITSGDDNQIIVWDYRKHEAKAFGHVNEKPDAEGTPKEASKQSSRSICYNPSTSELAFGVSNGEVQIRNLKDINKPPKKVIKCGGKWIQYMAYSPDGKYLAVGTHDNIVALYTVGNYSEAKKFVGHAAPIVGLDWSVDSKYLRTLDYKNQMKFWDITKLEEEKNGPTVTKDLDWATYTSKVGWHVMGIFPEGVAIRDVMSVAKSSDNRLVITGDANGLINILNYPSFPKAKAMTLR